MAGLVVATFGRILQALMLRAMLDLGRDPALPSSASGMLVLAGVAMTLLLLQVPISLGLLGIGRRLEVRLRKAYFEKLPKTEDRYFQSRLASDMASRCHNIQTMRTLPALIAQSITVSLEVLATAGALVWAAPSAWGIVLALTAATLALPLLAQKLFVEPDLRVQTHAGSLSGFILNALLGLTPIRIHGAERSLRRGQEAMLVEWTKSRYWLQALTVSFEGVVMLVSYALVVLLVYSYLQVSGRAALVLLVVFWALRFPILGQRLLILTRTLPSVMNRVRRLLDIIGEIEPPSPRTPAPVAEPELRAAATREAPDDGKSAGVTAPNGVAIAMERVRIKGGGHIILDKVSLNTPPASTRRSSAYRAPASPAGGPLLGWLRPRAADRVDGELLDQPAIERLRRTTAWVDPAISIWNQSLLDNLRYGNDFAQGWSLEAALKGAEMLGILEALRRACRPRSARAEGWCPAGRANACAWRERCSAPVCGSRSSTSRFAGSTASAARACSPSRGGCGLTSRCSA
jgi:ABC-type multidrug transport system fused ATPase/permease subunit